MKDRTTRRLLALLSLVLGVLAWSAVTSLHAQAPQPPGQPLPPAPTAPPSAPSSPPPGGQPAPPPDAPPTPPPSVPMSASGTVVPPTGEKITASPAVRFQFKIDPKTPLKDLLPAPPKTKKITGPVLGNDLTRVPEIQFQATAAKDVPSAEAMKQIAHQIAKINHLNDKKTDGFLESLRGERLDLHGLPFAMGDACRTKGERSRQFARAVATVRRALQPALMMTSPLSGPRPSSVSVPVSTAVASGTAPQPTSGSSASTPTPPTSGSSTGTPNPPPAPAVATVSFAQAPVVDPPSADTFWEQYPTFCIQEDREQGKIRREQCETITQARIAALMQILAPMPEMHPGLVKYLSTVSHVEATRALARMAIFSGEEEARKAAIDALKVRRERDYTKILVEGLRYPWPAVARRAAEAITKLERNDLLPQLVNLLEEDDPRIPVTREVNQKRVPVVRELVRVNHHRSCLLCHAPGNTGKVSADTLTAEVPVPGKPLTPPSGGYNTSQQDILVRLDVTYLRQDFSMLQPVADANPWPEMQRFDFLVRSRELTDEEATAYREKLAKHEPGEFSPYQRAALAGLRELTGRDTEPTPEAWRRLLKRLAEPQRKTETP